MVLPSKYFAEGPTLAPSWSERESERGKLESYRWAAALPMPCQGSEAATMDVEAL